MNLQKWIMTALGAAWIAGSMSLIRAQADKEEPAPQFQEVFGLIRSNLAGMSEAELNRAATRGLLAQLGSQVVLVTNGLSTVPAEGPLIGKSDVYENLVAYLRVARVESGLAEAVRDSFQRLKSTNKLAGLVLDLRFAGGDDYSAAAQVADRFLAHEQPLLKWGDKTEHSTVKTNALKVPVAILVNRQTSGAAEALAAVLRQAGIGLLIGSPTAGEAHIFQEFNLSNGQRLRIARSRVQLPEGPALTAAGLTPDIAVAVSLEEERAYFQDAFKLLAAVPALVSVAGGTNALSGVATNPFARRGLNEAELVRRHREGIETDADAKNRDAETKPVIRDPVLARSIDFLKGLAMAQQLRSL
ncbi:MAG: S41 family peptidase [Verrucomicrobiota bacterium]